MKPSIDEVRSFLATYGLTRTMAMLETEYQDDPGSPRLPSEASNNAGPSQVLNLSFGENDSNQPRDSTRLDSHISTRNHADTHQEATSHSPNVSMKSLNRPNEFGLFFKSEILPGTQKKSLIENPFETGEEDIPGQKKSINLNADDDKFSFGDAAEEEPDHEFDSFSKSHNNKFSKNELEDGDEPNIFGNSFDLNPDRSGDKSGGQKMTGLLTNPRTGNKFWIDDGERAKSEVNAPVTDDTSRQIKARAELHRSDVKSIDNDVVLSHDMRTVATKRTSQQYNVFANNRGLAKQLFSDLDSEDVFDPVKNKTAIPPRRSEGHRQAGARGGTVKPDFADGGRLISD